MSMYNDNLARKHDYTQYSQQNTKTHDMTFGRTHTKTKAQKRLGLKCVAVLAFCVIGSLFLLSKNLQVTEQQKKVTQLNSEYSRLVSENKKAEVAINQKIDLKAVEELAISNYGMNRAKKSQIVYIDVLAEDYGILSSQKENKDNEKDKKLLSGLMAYLK